MPLPGGKQAKITGKDDNLTDEGGLILFVSGKQRGGEMTLPLYVDGPAAAHRHHPLLIDDAQPSQILGYCALYAAQVYLHELNQIDRKRDTRVAGDAAARGNGATEQRSNGATEQRSNGATEQRSKAKVTGKFLLGHAP